MGPEMHVSMNYFVLTMVLAPAVYFLITRYHRPEPATFPITDPLLVAPHTPSWFITDPSLMLQITAGRIRTCIDNLDLHKTLVGIMWWSPSKASGQR